MSCMILCILINKNMIYLKKFTFVLQWVFLTNLFPEVFFIKLQRILQPGIAIRQNFANSSIIHVC